MITRERLEELIEQGATIWHNEWEEIKLDKNTCEICEVQSVTGKHISWCLYFEYEWNNTKQHTTVHINELEEDVETSKWHYEMDCERTERLTLPTWEEFIEMEEFCFFQKNHKQTIIRVLGTKYLGVETNFERYYTGDLTKENYIKACRKAKELFLGESNGV